MTVSARAEGRPRYEALLADGTRIEGNRLHEWHNAGAKPKLDDHELLVSSNPMLWVRDRTLRPVDPPEAFVEMLSGDRLPGVVQSFRPAGFYENRSRPAHVVVRPLMNLHHPEDRRPGDLLVVERFVRRIVWQRRRGLSDGYEPSTIHYRDGRSSRFRVVRFEAAGVRLLQEDGSRRVMFGEIAELHLPLKDPWPSYYEELATLDPMLQSRLLQVETTDGLRVSGAICRFDAREGSQGKDNQRWLHALQPAWSLGLLWIPHRTVIVYRSFAPHQVPLSRVFPGKATMTGMLGGGRWHWQVNRNAQGGPLQCGQQGGGWGLGVHAFTELHFPLPPLVRSFRARYGLDDSVGPGGCVQVRVYAGSTASPPLVESPLIVGSQHARETGTLALDYGKGHTSLVLQVDTAHDQRPPGADPLDIRDVCNWLDPLLELDPAALKAEVEKRHASTIAAWEGWEMTPHGDGTVRINNHYETEGNDKGVFLSEVAAERQPFSLRRTVTLEPQHRWLLMGASVRSDYSNKIKLQVRLASEPFAEFAVPAGGVRESHELAFPLDRFVGQRVSVEIVQQPGDGRLNVWWRGLDLVDQLPKLHRVFDDAGTFESLDAAAGPATLIDSDRYSGEKCVKLPSGGRYRLAFDAPLRVRSDPKLGGYRILRMAFRKVGGGRMGVALEPNSEERPTMYDAGKGPPVVEKAKRVVGDELTGEWTVFTRDLVGDRREGDLTGLVFHVPDGEYLLVDHIYLARWHDDLRWLPPEPPWHLTSREKRQRIIDGVTQNTRAAVVGVEIEGRRATGTLLGGEGLVLTAGHVLGKPGRDATVTLSDGRTLPATTAGVDRANNLGFVKLKENPNVRGLEVRDWQADQERNLYFAWWHDPSADAAKPQVRPTTIWHAFYGTIWTEALPGGDWSIFRRENAFGEKTMAENMDLSPSAAQGGQSHFSRRKGFLTMASSAAPRKIGTVPCERLPCEVPVPVLSQALSGAPLLNWDGCLVGVLSRRSRFGGTLYSKANPVQDHWDRLKNGEVFGEWLRGAGPSLGASFSSGSDGCRVADVPADTGSKDLKPGDLIERLEGQPIERSSDIDRLLAAKDAGDVVTLDIARGGLKLQIKAAVHARRP